MNGLVSILLWPFAILGVLALVLLLLLVIPATVWLDYQKESLAIYAGVPGIRIKVFPPKPLTPEQQAKKDAQKQRKAAEKAAKKQAQKEERSIPQVDEVQQNAEKSEVSVKKVPKKKNALLQLTFAQICTAVGGVGTFGKAILGAFRIQNIRLYLPVNASDAAETAIQYGKMQAFLQSGIAVLDRFLWLDFEEFRLEADFMGDKAKSAYFSCRISTRLLLMVIAAVRLVWLLWTEKILDPLLDQLVSKRT